MTPVYHLAIATCMTLMLSACQPKADSVEPTQPAPADDVINNSTTPEAGTDDEGYVDNNLSANDMIADIAPMTAMQADYDKSITRMHDEMLIGMGYNDPDTTFAKSMLGHSRGALDMASLQLKYGSDPVMRQLAQQVINSQQGEINIINKWLASHLDSARAKLETPFVQQEYTDTTQIMLDEMSLSIADPVADVAFARTMLAHYISAGKMAKIELKYGTNEEMLVLARQIINAQQPIIVDLQNWLAANSTSLDSDNITDDDIADDADDNLTKEAIETN
ncbi:DUF305 domain-containing protein [Psychrobacter sp. M13]|uniref:DUF305 domain-containing protein n=1 Tax=Psychrobacter sp. M13 TaxID=3067275 RepID=UPI00273BED69|nr:DUF305 domain-containing protein [Psychrobacter sp. M13]WLP94886.1 DUF305 domain-containing protein [Psychrobacter sp. M13]